MVEEIEERWRQLSLTKEESDDVIIDKEWVVKGELCLIGKSLMRKPVNFDAMKNVLSQLWEVSHDLMVREVDDRIYLFQFANEEEKVNVLSKQPWHFNKSLIVLKEFNWLMNIEDINMNCWCPFWIQLHGLPLGLMTEKIGTVLGERIGHFEQVETVQNNVAFGKWLRVRVGVEVTKPLKRGCMINVQGRRIWISFKYERLPNFCYVCGLLDHREIECERAIELKAQNKLVSKEYGPWLRADDSRISSNGHSQSSAREPTSLMKSEAKSWRKEVEQPCVKIGIRLEEAAGESESFNNFSEVANVQKPIQTQSSIFWGWRHPWEGHEDYS